LRILNAPEVSNMTKIRFEQRKPSYIFGEGRPEAFKRASV
jgi:hypothetical protein